MTQPYQLKENFSAVKQFLFTFCVEAKTVSA